MPHNLRIPILCLVFLCILFSSSFIISQSFSLSYQTPVSTHSGSTKQNALTIQSALATNFIPNPQPAVTKIPESSPALAQITGHGMGFASSSTPPKKNNANFIAVMPTIPSTGKALVADSIQKNPLGASNPGDGACSAPKPCGDLTYNGGSVMHSVTFLVDLWVGCGTNTCYNTCSGVHYFDSSAFAKGGTDDCSYILQVEQYFQDFCSSGGLLPLINQYKDGLGGVGSCSLGHASTSPLTYIYDYTPFPDNPLTDGDIQNSATGAENYVFGSCCNQNVEVLVYTPWNEPSCGSGSTGCFNPASNQINFCAYHSWSGSLIYANLPDDYSAFNSSKTAFCGQYFAGFPTGDPIADLEVSPSSHEADESITDPSGNGWYYNDLSHEIGDECNQNFYGTESFDLSNVHLGGSLHLYDIQTEWSNFNNGCTLSLNGAATVVSYSLKSDSSTSITAASSNFSLEYVEEGEGAFSFISIKAPSTTSIFVTPDFPIKAIPSCHGGFSNCNKPGVEYEYCFSLQCAIQSRNITKVYGGTTSLTYYYYEIYQQNPYMKIIDGGTPPSHPTFTYRRAPSCSSACAGVADGTVSASILLPFKGPGPAIFAVLGSFASYNTCVPELSGKCPVSTQVPERWATGGPCGQGCLTTKEILNYYPNGIQGINYWHQFVFGATYAIVGGGCSIIKFCFFAPTLNGTQFGKNFAKTLSHSNVFFWLDATTRWFVTDPLLGSTLTEDWATPSPAGFLNSMTYENFTFYHQYFLRVSYVVLGGGSPTAPTMSCVAYAIKGSCAVPLGPSNAGYWLDTGSAWSILPNPLGGSTLTQRWETLNATAGIISSPENITMFYFHQYFVKFAANPSTGGTVPPSAWFDAGSANSITATPAKGFTFSSWTTSNPAISFLSSTSSKTTMTVNGSGTATANFA